MSEYFVFDQSIPRLVHHDFELWRKFNDPQFSIVIITDSLIFEQAFVFYFLKSLANL